jgi:hypothetical protein
MQYFDKKLPAEKTVLTFNLAAGLVGGALLSGVPTVAISTFVGTDASPGAIQNGAAGLDSTTTMVLVPVQAGIDGCEYLIEVDCATTNALYALGMQAVLPVGGEP